MNPQGTEWKNPCRKITKITSQAKDTTRWHITIWNTICPVPQATAMLDAKATVDKEWKKLETIPAWQMVSSWEQKEGDSGSTQRLTNSPRCCIDGHVPSQKKGGIRAKSPKNYESYFEVTLKKKQQLKCIRSFDGTRLICVTNDRRKIKGCHCSTTRLWWRSRWRRFRLNTGQIGGRSQNAQYSKVRTSRYSDSSSTTQMDQIMV